MADNTQLNAGTGGDIIATDDVGGVKYQRVKVSFGADGIATDVQAASPLPVDGSGVTQPVSGTVTANAGTNLNTSALALESGGNLATLAGAVSGTEMQVDIVTSALPTDAATATNQTTGNSSLSNIESGFAAEDAALGSGVLLQGDDGTNRKNVNVDATTGDVQVDVTNTVTISGTVTADAGTNLNTSALALESGGNLATLAGAVTGTEMQVDIVTQPARSAGTDSIASATRTDVLYDGATPVTPQFAQVDLPVDLGSPTVISDTIEIISAGSPSKSILILGCMLIASGDVTIRFIDGPGSPTQFISGELDLTANSGFTLPTNSIGWMKGSVDNGISIFKDLNVAVGGIIVYAEVD